MVREDNNRFRQQIQAGVRRIHPTLGRSLMCLFNAHRFLSNRWILHRQNSQRLLVYWLVYRGVFLLGHRTKLHYGAQVWVRRRDQRPKGYCHNLHDVMVHNRFLSGISFSIVNGFRSNNKTTSAFSITKNGQTTGYLED